MLERHHPCHRWQTNWMALAASVRVSVCVRMHSPQEEAGRCMSKLQLTAQTYAQGVAFRLRLIEHGMRDNCKAHNGSVSQYRSLCHQSLNTLRQLLICLLKLFHARILLHRHLHAKEKQSRTHMNGRKGMDLSLSTAQHTTESSEGTVASSQQASSGGKTNPRGVMHAQYDN